MGHEISKKLQTLDVLAPALPGENLAWHSPWSAAVVLLGLLGGYLLSHEDPPT